MTTSELTPCIRTDGVSWERTAPTGEGISILFQEIRRERTGVHALVALTIANTILAHDTFNITRSEDRRRLAKAAFSKLGDAHKTIWPLETLEHDLDLCALRTPRIWEEERIQVISYHHTGEPGPVEFALKPYIIKGGGTIFFAPPGTGKSYLLQTMGICIARGLTTIWKVAPYPVLYINLERSGASLERREYAILKALGLEGDANLDYIHARGMSFASVQRRARKWLEDTEGNGGVMLDSLSRGGVGDLNENDTGNRFIDMMNGLGASWWAAIGHTPRASGDHLYGSVHFDAGEDIGVKVASQTKDNIVGISLEIIKKNDIGEFPPEYIAYEFDAQDRPVSRIRTAKAVEFPELLAGHISTIDRIRSFIHAQPHDMATGTEIAKALRLDPGYISNLLTKSGYFNPAKTDGRNKFYGVATEGGT